MRHRRFAALLERLEGALEGASETIMAADASLSNRKLRETVVIKRANKVRIDRADVQSALKKWEDVVSEAAAQIASACGEPVGGSKEFNTGFLDPDVTNLIPSAYELKIRLVHFLTSLKCIVQCSKTVGDGVLVKLERSHSSKGEGLERSHSSKGEGLSRLPMFMSRFNDLNSPSTFNQQV